MLTPPSHRRRTAFSRAVRRILSGQWRGFCGFPLHDARLLLQQPQFKLHIPRTTFSRKCSEKHPAKWDSRPPRPPPLLPPCLPPSLSSVCRSDQSALPQALICVGGVQRVKGDVEDKRQGETGVSVVGVRYHVWCGSEGEIVWLPQTWTPPDPVTCAVVAAAPWSPGSCKVGQHHIEICVIWRSTPQTHYCAL